MPAFPRSATPVPEVHTKEPAQEGERRFTVERGQELPKVMIGYHIPEARHADTCALEVVASLLGDDKRHSSRLYARLIDSGLASEVYACTFSLRDPGLFTLFAAATPGTPLDRLEEALLSELARLSDEVVDEAELDRARKAVWKRMKLHAADPVGMADQLAEALAVADWRWWANLETNIKAVSARDVQRVARSYFTRQNRTVGWYQPRDYRNGEAAGEAAGLSSSNKPSKAATPAGGQAIADEERSERCNASFQSGSASNTLETSAATQNPAAFPDPAAGRQSEAGARLAAEKRESGLQENLPARGGPVLSLAAGGRESAAIPAAAPVIAPHVVTEVLPNGLTIQILPMKGSGVAAISGKVIAGACFRDAQKSAVPLFTAGMLDKGSANYTKKQFAEVLESLGTSLEFSAGNFWTEFRSQVVSEDLEELLPLIADALKRPLLERGELEKMKALRKSELEEAQSDTGEVALNALAGVLYAPDCVYHEKSFAEQIKELPRISSRDLRIFHSRFYSPASTYMAIAGEVEVDKTLSMVRRWFGSWTGQAAAGISVDNCAHDYPAGTRVVNCVPDKTNVDVIIGAPANTSVHSPDFYAVKIANAALGHDTISSRLAVLREKHGLTYGISSRMTDNSFGYAPWLIELSVAPENLDSALTLVRQVVDKYVEEGISERELKEESLRLAGEFLVERMRTPAQIAEGLTRYQLLGLGPAFMDSYPKRLAAVGREDVNRAIGKYFSLRNSLTSIAGTVSPAAQSHR